ncbi:hypothetical protein COCSUDRAFT_58179 [Coccomyxa subellipsoidea C-169]|uniref:Fatty acid synthase n=1 Tax=Coccomyxa subellipsoidea (strain C-169) TaxID=574566 RepID=I0YNH3_COCSC|nr:hypothetical protein COCSUDRAFT_58179 [Coccomyxa subellipsoidea C-169]EIE19942.1 hypothetical protein COCSUDRAFT_58179 [Coccomyxa subellipsoidea C-169]|eukprot:XP_005644486.1 hypothetical protein COCSUDRAFT_58179 [Coccomyxa subellipsoidea C-169]
MAQPAAQVLGYSCRLPESGSPSEFWENLLTGVDMQTQDDRRWPVGQLKTPPRSGKLPDYDKFDASFFTVHAQQANKMDPQLRKLLEVSYEALIHSGLIIGDLPSERCGVYVGCCGSEVHAQWLADVDSVTGYEQTGCAASMFANRLSWFYNFKGPSKIVDTACSSSFVALNDAISDIKAGVIDYAVVGGASAILRPQTSVAFSKLNMLSPEGHCKSFDASANGYARADGIVAIVLARPGITLPQFAPVPPRGDILAIATNNDGRTKEGVTFPSGPAQRALAEVVCAQAGIKPSQVAYVEAHGTGTVVGDGQELGALEEFYAIKGERTVEEPLLIGSVKSNMGHCEGCSGLAGLLKVLMSFEHGTLPANLHFNEPNPNNKSLKEGVIKVVTETTPWEGGIVAQSNFGFGGTNVHLLVQGGPKPSLPLGFAPSTPDVSDGEGAALSDSQGDTDEEFSGYNGIIPLAARTQQGFEALVKSIQAVPGLIEDVAASMRRFANSVGADSTKLTVRGTLHKGVAKSATASSANAPIWFAFSGNGSQWPKMGLELLSESPAYSRGVKACAEALQPFGINLIAAFSDEAGFSEDPILAAVGLIALQVGLTDMLAEEYGIVPAGFLGHSAGEIACGYADGGFTREQAVLVAYHRARQWPDGGLAGGLMAATGLSAAAAAERLKRECLSSCVVACDNSPTSTTLSGPKKELQPVLDALKAEGVFVRALSTCEVAYHSPLLDPVLPQLSAALEALIPTPKPRSERWVSAAFPAGTEDPDALLCSAAYQVHAFRNRVQFTDAAAAVPKNAILLEVGPHGVLRSPLRQCRPEVPYVATIKKESNASLTVPNSVCELWRKGATLSWPVEKLSKEATELPAEVAAALVSWDHSGDYPLPNAWLSSGTAGFTKTFKLDDPEHAFIADHNVDGRILMPATSYLVTAWEALAAQQEKKMSELPVLFEDVSIVQAVPVAPGGSVTQGGDLIAEGKISVVHQKEGPKPTADAAEKEEAPEKVAAEETTIPTETDADAEAEPTEVDWSHGALDTMEAPAFYRQVLRTGIRYGPHFRMLVKKTIDGSAAVLRWDACFIRLLDGLLQAGALNATDTQLRVPTGIRRLLIKDANPASITGSEGALPMLVLAVEVDSVLGLTTCAMADISGVELGVAPLRPPNFHTVERQARFVSEDTERLAYYRKLEGFLAATIRPHLVAMQASEEGLPDHLQKVLKLVNAVPYEPPSAEEEEAFLAEPCHILARLYRDLFKDEETAKATLADPNKAIVQHPEHKDLYANDAILRGFEKEVLIVMLDIVEENVSTDGFRCAEVGAGTGGFTRQVIDELDRCPYSQLLKYVATDVSASWGAALTKSLKVPALEFKVWDINKPAGKELEGPFDLILASNAIHTLGLANITEQLAPGGFLLAFEGTRPLPALAWGLDKVSWNFTDEREYGLWMSPQRWHAELAAAGLVMVSEHTCPDASGCMFLYRKPDMAARNDIILRAPRIGASEAAMDTWLHDYTDSLDSVAGAERGMPATGGPKEEEPAAAGRLWLTGTLQSNAGILGLMKCARAEPRGGALRCVMDASSKYSLHTGDRRGDVGDGDADLAPLVERARQLDLTFNVFVDGRHGAYRLIPMPADRWDKLSARAGVPQGAHLQVQTYGDLNSMRWVQNLPLPSSADGYVVCDVDYGALNFRDVMLAYGKLSRDLMAHGKNGQGGGDYIGLEFSGKVGERRVMGVGQNAIATRLATRGELLWDYPADWTAAQAATVPVAYCTAYYSLVMRGRLRPGQRVLIHSGSGAVGLAAIAICLHRGCEVFVTCGSAEKKAFMMERFPALKEDHIGDSRSTSFEALVLRATKGAGVHMVLNSLAGDKLQASVRCIASYGKLLEIGKYDILKGTGLSMRPLLRNIEFHGIDLDRVFNDGEDPAQMAELSVLVNEGIRTGEVQPLPFKVYKADDVPSAFRYMASGTHIGKVLVQPTLGTDEVAPSSELSAVPQISFRPDRTYVITGGLGGFGLAMATWMAEKGARSLVLTSKRGMRTGEQAACVQRLRDSFGAKVAVSTLDVANHNEAHALIKLADSQAPVGGVFHLAMILSDRFLTNQTGESWQKVVECKAQGALHLDMACQGLTHLEHFVIYSSQVAWVGNEGQGNYAWANMVGEMLCESRRRVGLPGLAISWGAVAGVGYIEEIMHGKIIGRKFEINPPQPIEDCLVALGKFLCGGPGISSMMGCNATLTELYSNTGGDSDKGLVASVLGLMGLKEGEVGENDSLADLGLDSLQLVEIRSKIGTLTLAGLRELAEEAGESKTAPAEAAEPSAAEEPQEAAVAAALKLPADDARPSTPPLEKEEIAPRTPDRQSLPNIPRPPSPTALTTPVVAKPVKAYDGKRSARSLSTDSAFDSEIPVPAVAPKSAAQKTAPGPAPAAATAAAAAAADERPWQREAKWAVSTFIGVLYIGCVLMSVGVPCFAAAAGVGVKLGIWAALPLIPMVWLALGFGLCFACVLTKRNIGPQLSPRHPIKMFSGDFARWWLVNRMVGVTTMIFADQLRSTGLLVSWLRAMGARIGENVVIDTLDVTDFDLISIGDNVAIGEGATVMGHYYRDGFLHFDEVDIGDGCRLDPFSLAGPGLTLLKGEQLPALATKPRKAAPVRKTKGPAAAAQQSPHMVEALTLIESPAVAGMYTIALVTAPAVYSALFVIARTMAFLGLQLPFMTSPAVYAVAALTAMVSPLFIPMLFLALPAEAGALAALLHPATALLFVPLVPVAYVIFGVLLCTAMVAIKWAALGCAKPGTHRRLSEYGLRFWLAQRAVEMGYKRFAIMCMGTWAINVYLRAMGAKIAKEVNIRFGNMMLTPDMLDIAEGVHIGDTANILTSMALDADRVLVGKVDIGQQAMLGLASVLCPATRVGKGVVLGGQASAEPGADLMAQMLYFGTPATALFKTAVRLGVMDPATTPGEKLRFAFAPLLQPLLAFLVVTIAAHAASILAAAVAALAYSPNVALALAPLVYTAFGAGQILLIAGCKALLVGKLQPGRVWKKNEAYNLQRTLVLMSQIPLSHTFAEAIRGSFWHNVSGRIWGMTVGKEVFADSCMAHNDFDLPLAEDGVIVGRNAIVFCHLGTYRKDGQLVIHQDNSWFGKDSIIGARCTTLPGYDLPASQALPPLQLGSAGL